jgi:beta-N-acetylglucosaminidase
MSDGYIIGMKNIQGGAAFIHNYYLNNTMAAPERV